MMQRLSEVDVWSQLQCFNLDTVMFSRVKDTPGTSRSVCVYSTKQC